MARRIAAGDESGARHSQNRAVELTLLLSVPCLVAFLLVPELIMRALFVRGAFTVANAQAAGATLTAYAIGLLPFVLMRSAAVTFLSRGDTMTPVKALFFAVAVNVALKILLMDHYAQVGLAFATSIGAWVNLTLLSWFAARRNLIVVDATLRRSVVKLALAGVALAVALMVCQRPVADFFSMWPTLRDEMTLLALAAIGGVVYGGVVLALFGRQWLAMLRGHLRTTTPPADHD
jgi:putative peptidoglycan lipid II flippase